MRAGNTHTHTNATHHAYVICISGSEAEGRRGSRTARGSDCGRENAKENMNASAKGRERERERESGCGGLRVTTS